MVIHPFKGFVERCCYSLNIARKSLVTLVLGTMPNISRTPFGSRFLPALRCPTDIASGESYKTSVSVGMSPNGDKRRATNVPGEEAPTGGRGGDQTLAVRLKAGCSDP